MKLVLQQLPNVRGTPKASLLSPVAADSLSKLDKEAGGLIYTDMWRDPISSLLSKRTRRSLNLPGYCGHNFGLGIDLDVTTYLEEKKIRYEDLLYLMKKRGWYCHRRDGDSSAPGFDHFNFLGDTANQYLLKCTMDPITWGYPVEERIYERYGKDFQLSVKTVQERLSKIGLYQRDLTGTSDLYTREAVMAFQRTWDMIENGNVDATLCRVLAFVTCDLEVQSAAVQRA